MKRIIPLGYLSVKFELLAYAHLTVGTGHHIQKTLGSCHHIPYSVMTRFKVESSVLIIVDPAKRKSSRAHCCDDL